MTRRIGRRHIVVAAVASGSAVAALWSVPVSAVDGDIYGLRATVQPAAHFATAALSTTYALANGTCEVGPASVFVDTAHQESGGCQASAADGSQLSLTGCSTGSMSAAGWQLTEPSGDVASFNGAGVVVGGVVIVAGLPQRVPGDGYSDPATSGASPAVVIGLLTPQVPQLCARAPGVSSFDLTAVLAAEY